MGATEMCYSDRHAYEVVKVIDEKHVLVRKCKATRIDKNGMSDCQEYEYELEPYKEFIKTEEWMKANEDRMMYIKAVNPKFYKKIQETPLGGILGDNNIKLVKTKTGWRERQDNGKLSVNRFTLGIKEEYFDYSF